MRKIKLGSPEAVNTRRECELSIRLEKIVDGRVFVYFSCCQCTTYVQLN